MQHDTWEAQIYRCTVCFSIFSDEINDTHTPYVVCDNLHSLCMGCISIIQTQEDSRCPCCRGEIKSTMIAHRDLMYLTNRLLLPCGLCDNTSKMSCKQAKAHASECPENMITCPMTTDDIICKQNMAVSKLWNHFFLQHNNESDNAISKVRSDILGENRRSVTFTSDVNCITSHIRFFSIQDNENSHNLCLHIEKNTHDEYILIYIRRFFNNNIIDIKKIFFSIEVGQFSGIILENPETVMCHEVVSNSSETISSKIVCLPLSLLHQMQKSIPGDKGEIKMQITIQIIYDLTQ